MNSKPHDPSLILAVGIILSIIRVLLAKSEYLDYIVSAINLVAIAYVIWSILNNAKIQFTELTTNSKLGNTITKKKKLYLKRICTIIEVFIFFIFSPIYLIYYSNGVCNDVISIITLCISIEDTSISNFIANYFYSAK